MINPKDLPAPDDRYAVKRALLSVFDKSGLVPFATRLRALGVELISTGGTARAMREAGLDVVDVSEVTGFPEILGGRVKSLHPAVHGGLLARKNDPEDLEELSAHNASPIDLVVVNLYPFAKTIAREGVTDAEAIENIDIGGPTMIRSAAKNFAYVGVVTSPDDYDDIAGQLEEHGGTLDMATRRDLARKAFGATGSYDSAISSYFESTADHEGEPSEYATGLPLHDQLRYGENPHQGGGIYGDPSPYIEQLHGKALSFNNYLDLTAALALIEEFKEAGPTCAILKHTNPCGVAVSDNLLSAYENAFACDRQSPFGGIVIVNRELDLATAEAIDAIFTEIIIAPSFADGVLDFLQKKKNRRLIRSLGKPVADSIRDVRSTVGGMLVQDRDPALPSPEGLASSVKVVTKRSPSDAEMVDLDLAWRVVKHVKSNAIVYVKGGATIGIGAGQMSRIDSSEIAVAKGKKSELNFDGCVVASDAFFPFADGLLAAADVGASAVIQPGGSIRDEEVIGAADERGVAMVFTGKRHFRH